MNKLLIVDDEEFVRTSIINIIDWSSLGFTEVFQAENGVEALELSIKVKPDLVLTDIRMPFMDGIELSSKLREQLPDTNIVILSGYDEFKYAQSAITYGVLDYILKPIGPTSLTEKMREIKAKLDQTKSVREHLNKVRKQLHQSMPLLVEKFLNSLLNNSSEVKTYAKTIDFLELPIRKGPYLICIIEPDLNNFEYNDAELYSFAVKNIVEETFASNNPVFYDSKGRIIAIYCFNSMFSFSENHSIIYKLLYILKTNVNYHLNIQVTTAKGSFVNELNNLYMSYNEAVLALESKYIYGKDNIYDIQDIKSVETNLIYPHDSYIKFMDAVKSTNSDLIRQAASLIVLSLKKKSNITSANIKIVFIDIITSLLKQLTITKESSSSVLEQGVSLFKQMEKLSTLEELANATTEFAINVANEISKSIERNNSSIIGKVIEYISENYNSDSISLSSSAEYVNVNASYLSTLFKKEMNQNFIDYLNSIRINKAIELLQTTDLRTYEVAYSTGFSNPHYFSILFKKLVGISPSKFKGGNNE